MDKSIFNSVDLIAFDFFDTLVHRKCSPEKIISMWAKAIAIIYRLDISAADIYNIRKNSEKELRKKGFKDVAYDQIMERVYLKLSVRDYLNDVSFNEFVAECKKIEYKYEIENIYIDEDNVELAKSIGESGKKLIIISDFYLGKEFLLSLCRNLRIDDLFEEIYVSCDYNARKSTGELYDIVLKKHSLQSQDLIMIGDNPVSDRDIPSQMGINVHPVENRTVNGFLTEKRKLEKLIEKICRSDHVFDGYTSIMYLFIAKLYKAAVDGRCKKLLFCSREGQLLKELFDTYQKVSCKENTIKSEYFYISRRATFIASLNECDIECFERMFLNYSTLTIVDFLDNLGFEQNEIYEMINSAGCDPSMMSVPRGKCEKFDDFLNNPLFIKAFNDKRNEAKLLIKEYIEQTNGLSEIWMVDIGWRGSIQDNLFSALDRHTKITGLYFGLIDACKTPFNNKIGIIFDNNKDNNNYKLMSYNYIDLEKVCSANHGPVCFYYRDNGRIVPQILDSFEELAIYRYVEDEQMSLKNSFMNMCQCFENSIYEYSDLVYTLKKEYLFHLCVKQPKNYKYYYNYRSIFVENFGAKKTEVSNKFTFGGYSLQFHWGLVNYVFRALDKANLRFLYPIGSLYCRIIYFFKKGRMTKKKNEHNNKKI